MAASGSLRFVENSGICETTPGVYQASGYVDLSEDMSMWFWFFEARNSPETAPLSIWLNGGPGSSSMIGLFQENGPCRINNDSQGVSHNPYSWNEHSHMLYIDQPVGVGYSHGTLAVTGSWAAAEAVYQMLQLFFADPTFSKYKTDSFALWTESYGGHYGPAFSHYFQQQNALVESGEAEGLVKINLKVLGIGNGLTDPLNQYPEYLNFAVNNSYLQTVNDTVVARAKEALYNETGCLAQIQQCYDTNVAVTCNKAMTYCNNQVLSALAGSRYLYDIRTTSSAYPPSISAFLRNETMMALIGAENYWEMSNIGVYSRFSQTGDWMKNFAPDLAVIVDSGVRTHIFAGDADFICNAFGVEATLDHLQSKFKDEYAAQEFSNWTVNGVHAGLYKNAGTLSYLRVAEAGHEVPAYGKEGLDVGQAALAFFRQVMLGEPISSTQSPACPARKERA
ncbi:alpha/beta-hydrolase [Auricularia subglabra TFB-10046 SS5]|nr:alpha/beta-hydrolase [Auricularia subglabra TFB-10046 SS5]